MSYNGTDRLARISADTGLSIDEAQQALNDGLIDYDYETHKYFLSPKAYRQAKSYAKKPLSKAELRWLTK